MLHINTEIQKAEVQHAAHAESISEELETEKQQRAPGPYMYTRCIPLYHLPPVITVKSSLLLLLLLLYRTMPTTTVVKMYWYKVTKRDRIWQTLDSQLKKPTKVIHEGEDLN